MLESAKMSQIFCCCGRRKKANKANNLSNGTNGSNQHHEKNDEDKDERAPLASPASSRNALSRSFTVNRSFTAESVQGFSLLSGMHHRRQSDNPLSESTTKYTILLDSTKKRWLSSFCRCDPRWQIHAFFLLAAQQGAAQMNFQDTMLKVFSKARVFTVWRPCSVDAIQKMIRGEAVGKGLEIKGKSARKGCLSGLVPYLQIHTEKDKRLVGTLRADGRVRIFFKTEAARDNVLEILEPALKEMMASVRAAKRTLNTAGTFTSAIESLNPFSDHETTKAGKNGLKDELHPPSEPPPKRHSFSFPGRSLIQEVSGRKIKRRISHGAGRKKMVDKPNSYSLDTTGGNSTADTSKRQFLKKGLSLEKLPGLKRKMTAEQIEQQQEDALEKLVWDIENASIKLIDEYAPKSYGIELPQRLLWKIFVTDQPIEREGNLVTGRPSEPFFQDMNNKAIFKSTRPSVIRDNKKNKNNTTASEKFEATDGPCVVLWQTTEAKPLDPRTLVMAYEEHGKVLPVVSDFDCFTMGTRGVKYSTALPDDQIELLKWCVENAEGVLKEQHESDTPVSWASRWLEVLKVSANKGFHPTIPRFGFGDKKSYEMMKGAVGRSVQVNGAVRHGAECFNYYFPQELDEEFLIVSDMLPGNVKWKYVNVNELQGFLGDMIDEGFTFPLNPKWVLCDPNWKRIYDHLSASTAPDVQDSLSIWYPPETGVREKFEAVCAKYPDGYVFEGDGEMCGTEAMDLATLQLKRYLTLQRAKRKLRAVLFFNKLHRQIALDNKNDAAVASIPEAKDGEEDNGSTYSDCGEFESSDETDNAEILAKGQADINTTTTTDGSVSWWSPSSLLGS